MRSRIQLLSLIATCCVMFSSPLATSSVTAEETPTASKPGFVQPDPKAYPDLFTWTDTCNVYVWRDGDAALVVDLGDGSVLDHLAEVGVKRVEWILLTHHHREQCQGIDRVDRKVTKVAAPKAEQALFERPTEYRKWFPTLGDIFSVYGASYARPPRQPIIFDMALESAKPFAWRGREIQCLDTPGHSPGSMSYVLHQGGKTIAFTGGVIHDGAKLTTWFDSEWDYGFAQGIDTLVKSVDLLADQKLDLALPSAGPAIQSPQSQLAEYRQKLTAFRESYIRGYKVFNSTEQERDSISKPTAVPLISQVTPHLYKLSHKTQGKNFAIIVSDNGRGLILDCGLFPVAMLEEIIVDMREHMGLKGIDAFWISHMHGDHFLLGPTLKEKYGAKAWTLDKIVDKCEHPRRYDYAALVSAYGDGFDGMKIDKGFRDGEAIEWEGYKIQVDWMPGQTEFGCCLWLEIDGKRIAFTGDNLFGNPADPLQNGHEAVVARNSAIFEEGYLLGSRYIKDLKPDIVMGSHSNVMHDPAAFLGRYHEWSKQIIEHYRGLLPDKDYEYLFDPYWVSAFPYRVDFSQSDVQTVTVTVRNFRAAPQRHRVELKLPPGVTAEPAVLEGTIAAESRQSYPLKLTVKRGAVPPGIQIVPFDITLDGKRYGELFDFIMLADEAPKPISVLLVGNSQCPTLFGEKLLEKLAASDKGAPAIKVGGCIKGGASLKSHWEAGTGPDTARGMIATKDWDYVVLQDIYNVEEPAFQPYARQFHELIKESGGKTVLFGTASILSDYPAGFERLHRMHQAMGKELGVPIVDASQAYFKYFGDQPSTEKMESLFAKDKAHPGLWGSYMYSCGIYSVLTGRSAVGLAAPETIPAGAAKLLQETAWAQYQETAAALKK